MPCRAASIEAVGVTEPDSCGIATKNLTGD